MDVRQERARRIEFDKFNSLLTQLKAYDYVDSASSIPTLRNFVAFSVFFYIFLQK